MSYFTEFCNNALNVSESFDSQMLKMNAQVNRSLANTCNMLDTAMCAPMFANYSGKLDMIIQLPYIVKSDMKRAQALQRRKDLEDQLENSRYGIGYIDGTEKIVQLNRSVHYADNMPVETMTWQHESKPKVDIFEAMNLLLFPYDPIRDYTKREVEKINERFRKVESLLGL